MGEETAVVRTIGRYHVLEEIGRGGMGVVYRGFDPVIGRTIALKTISIGATGEEGQRLRQRLYREASAAGTLVHPNIVTVFDVIEEGDTTAVAMELVEGETLAALIDRSHALPLDRALEIFEQIAAALDYAGGKGIVHRDIKPANILMTRENRPKVTDFGIARLASIVSTQSSAVVGSPSYMSPEQVRGFALDPRSDLFSAACVLYEMITGVRPFAAADAATTMYRIVNEAPQPVEQLNPSVGPALSQVLARALAKDPAGRYPSGAALVADLRQALSANWGGGVAGAVPIAPLPQLPPRAPATPARSPLLLYGLAGLGVILVAGIGFLAFGGREQGTPQAPTGDAAPVVVRDVPDVPRQPAGETRDAEAPAAPAPSYPGPVSTVPPPIGQAPAVDAPKPAALSPARAAAQGVPPAPATKAAPVATKAVPGVVATPRPIDQAPVRVGGNISPPERIKNVAPVYPSIAQSARVQGVVIVEATIGTDGKVKNAKILRSIPLLDDAALDAVRQWEFRPTLLEGVAVPVIMTVTVNFTLQ